MRSIRPHHPRTTIGLALAIIVLVGGCIGAWRLVRPPLDFLIIPGAIAVNVQSSGLSDQQIAYRWDGAPYGWYFAIIRNLSNGGWSAPIDNRAGLVDNPEIHWRISQLWFVYVEEEISLQGEPHLAHILVRRRLIIPWRRLFSR